MKAANRRKFTAALVLVVATSALAQAQDIKRTIVTKADVCIGGREAVVARVELEPDVVAGRHSHSGDEISYVLEGEGELMIDGEVP
jgi:quercetin dioxygenase-like cupin family protein